MFGKQTYEQLGLSPKTIQKEIDKIVFDFPPLVPRACVISFDTTCFGKLGVSACRDITNKENLLWVFVEHENQSPYDYMYNKLKEANFKILGIVVDGRKPFYSSFDKVPIQMCHFHMAKILSRYITRNPNLEVNKDLWDIWFRMDLLSASKLHNELHQWYCKYADELVQGYIDPRDNRWHYSKERTLKAYLSLRSFTRYLFTYKTSKWIPNTNNSTEGMFSQMKKKLEVHTGLNWMRKMKIIHYYLLNNKPK